MSIIVVCPGCRKSFQVSDKFAGKSGPCPACKRVLQVPAKTEEVKVHAPTEFAGGGRSTTGKLVIKPVAFEPTKAQPVTVTIIVAAVLVVIVVARLAGGLFCSSMIATTIGLLIVSPPLALAAYKVLHNSDLEPFRGKELYIRSSLCALAYVVLWGMFTLLASRGVISGDLWVWLFVAPAFVSVGSMFAMAAFDFEFGDALFHYGFYLIATLILRWLAGMKWVWDVSL
jgi:hypothetical protein